MKKKAFIWGVVLVFLCTMVLAGCSDSNNTGNTPKGSNNSTANDNKDKADGMDVNDLSEKITIHLLSPGWLNRPRGDDDPMQKWIDETFNIEFKFENVPFGDLENKLSLAFSSNEPPDLILFPDKVMLTKFYNEGVLIDDWTPYLDQVPAITDLFNDQSMTFASLDGKMAGLPKGPREYSDTYLVRKDWMAKLGLNMPKTDQDLLNILRKFTHDDPDGNGKNDTWGISSAGQGANFGYLGVLENMYGPAGFYIDKNGKANHSILDGNHKKFLDFVKTLVDEKLIDPDWYTQGHPQRKAKAYAGAFGMAWNELGDWFGSHRAATEGKVNPMDWWDIMPLPSAGEGGGKRPPRAIASGIYTVSKKAAEDPKKLARIMKVLNDVTYPNEGYFKLRWGVGLLPGSELVQFGDNLNFCTNDCIASMDPGWIDWGSWIAVLDRTTSQKELNDWVKEEMPLKFKAEELPANENIQQLVNFDPQNKSDADQVMNEFDIKYVLGEDTDYNKFKDRWLKQGGQALLDQVTEQLVNK